MWQDSPDGGSGDAAARREEDLLRTRAEAQRRFEQYLAQVKSGLPADAEPDFAGADAATAEELRRIVADYRLLRREYRESAATLAAGKRLGKFLLVREIGRGGMGVVWEAEQSLVRRRVALKVLHPQLASDELWVRRFGREAAAVASIAHPAVVRVHEAGVHDGLHWISMELVSGGVSLADHVADMRRRGAAPPDHARNMARMVSGLARGLQAAHEAGIVHRDVKPGNILMAAGGGALLADFGLAALEGGLSATRSGERAGSPYYMSPEQARGDERIDARSDIYSLGVTLYEALTFERPHVAKDEHELLRRIVQDELPDPRVLRPGVPRDLARIVLRMASNRRSARYPSAGEAADDLDRFLRGERVRTGPPSRLWRAWRLVRRYPAWSSAAAGMVCAFLLFSVLSMRAASEERRAGAASGLVQAVIRLDDPATLVEGPGALAELADLLRKAAASTGGDDRPRSARLHLAAARCERLGGRLRAAAESLRAALRLLAEGTDSELRLQVLDALAAVLGELDDFAGLQEVLPQALALSKELDRPSMDDGEPNQRTWRLLCALWSGHLRREDRAAAAALEAANPELAGGDLLARLQARSARLAEQGPAQAEAALEAELQLMRALCSLERYKEALELHSRLLAEWHPEGAAAERMLHEAALLHVVCEGRLRLNAPSVRRAAAERLAQELARAYGPEHPLALLSRLRVCVAIMDDPQAGSEPGGWPAVCRRYEELVSDMRRMLGPVHLDTLKARTGMLIAEMNLHLTHGAPARMRELRSEAEDLVASMRRTYGPFHSRTMIAERARLGLLEILGETAPAIEVRRRLVDHMAAGEGVLAPDALDMFGELHERLLWAGEVDEACRRAADYRRILSRVEAVDGVRSDLELRGIVLRASSALLAGRDAEAQAALADWDRHVELAVLQRAMAGELEPADAAVMTRRVLQACLAADVDAAIDAAGAWERSFTFHVLGQPLPLLVLHIVARRRADPRLDAALAGLRARMLASDARSTELWRKLDDLAMRIVGPQPR